MSGKSIAFQFGFAPRAVALNIEGVSEEDARKRPTGGGNSINWVVGHIISSRQGVLTLLGAEPTWPRETTDAYARGTSGDIPAAAELPLSRLLEDLSATTPIIVERLEALSGEELAAPSSNPEQTLGQRLAFLVFHESYHVGQLGLLRRLIGKPGAIR
jgi:uncharacterized damage-inducible protein DinB